MFPSIMWLTPLGLLAPLIWISHKVVSLMAILTQDGQLIALASFIRFVLYPLWGIIW